MKAWLMALAFSRRAQLVTKEFTANGTLVVPGGVSSANISGYGARGQNATSGSAIIRENKTIYATRRDNGVREAVFSDRYIVVYRGQQAYCDPINITPTDPTHSSNQTCYAYDLYSESPPEPATRGASATGLGKTFAGSLGNVQQTETSFANVPVTGGASYNIVVPAGGRITVTYYQ